MIERIERAVRGWVKDESTWKVMVKTALSHALVWGGATLVGVVLGYALILLTGIYPIFAISVPLLFYALGARFYMDREFLAEEGDFWKSAPDGSRTWRERAKAAADSLLDFVVPWAVASLLIYAAVLLYSVGGL